MVVLSVCESEGGGSIPLHHPNHVVCMLSGKAGGIKPG